MSELESAIWDAEFYRLTHPDLIADEPKAAWQKADTITASDLAAIENRVAAVARKQARLTRAVASLDDDLAAAPLLAELRVLGAEQQAPAAERETLADCLATRVSHERLIAELEERLPLWTHWREHQLSEATIAD